MPAPTHPDTSDVLIALRAAARRYRTAVTKMEQARPYANLGRYRGGTIYQDAIEELRAARSSLHEATVAAVHAGTKQAEAARIAGLTSPHVCRIMRGVTSGRIKPPPSQRVLLEDRVPVQEILTRYRSGESSIRLAQEFKCSKESICGLLKKHGVPRRGRRIDLPVSAEELARRYKEDRMQIQDIAAELGVKSHLISRRLTEAGVQVPVGHRRMDLPDAEIVERYRRGERILRLADEYGVSTRTISRRIQERHSGASS